MKLCALQIPFAGNPSDAEKSVAFVINELKNCDESCDLILTPEYSNAPSRFPQGNMVEFAAAHTAELIETARATARRCNAIVAVNYLCETSPGIFRNTTRVFDRNGNIAGEFYKQHLPPSEKSVEMLDKSYTWTPSSPAIVEIEGLRIGFLICYDSYFMEYIAHLAYSRPDIVLVSSFQRGERHDMLRTLNKHLAFQCNSYILRSSVSMGENAETGGCSMIVSPAGHILAEFGNRTGQLVHEIVDPHEKYMRGNAYGGNLIPNDRFIQQGRTPWSYRPCGSMTIPGEKDYPYPRVCAHRGFNTVAPENTLPAFGAAISLGAPEIELDVRFTKDLVPVICHDDSLDRVSNGHGLIQDYTLAELQELEFGGGKHPHFSGLRVVTFEKLLSRFARHAIINLHIKPIGREGALEGGGESEDYPEEYFRKIVDLLERYDQMEHVYIMAEPCIHIRALEIAPQIPRCMAANGDAWGIVERAIEYKCQKVQFFKQYCNQAMIDKAHAHGIRCNLFYCDDPSEVKHLLEMGIDTLLTNDYLAVANAVEAIGKS